MTADRRGCLLVEVFESDGDAVTNNTAVTKTGEATDDDSPKVI